MSIQNVQAIDVHAHYGVYRHEGSGLTAGFMSGDAQVVLARAAQAQTRLTIVSPLLGLLPRLSLDAVQGNEEAAKVTASQANLRHWVIIDPRLPRTFDQASDMLASPQCAGIKIHPEEHGYPIAEHGARLLEFAASHGAVVMTHSGEKNSLPADFLPFVDAISQVKVILAHLGMGWDGDMTHQVRAIQTARHGNLFADTSSARSITPGLIEWAVAQVGAERLLFGTDSPLYFAAMQRARIDHAAISEAQKRRILCENAMQLLKLTAF